MSKLEHMDTLHVLPPFLQRASTFVTSCLLSFGMKSFKKGSMGQYDCFRAHMAGSQSYLEPVICRKFLNWILHYGSDIVYLNSLFCVTKLIAIRNFAT